MRRSCGDPGKVLYDVLAEDLYSFGGACRNALVGCCEEVLVNRSQRSEATLIASGFGMKILSKSLRSRFEKMLWISW